MTTLSTKWSLTIHINGEITCPKARGKMIF